MKDPENTAGRAGGKKWRILYVGHLGPTATSTHRKWALDRLGHQVGGFDPSPYERSGSLLLRRIRMRTMAGPAVQKLNRRLLEAVDQFQPELVWFDQAKFVQASTVRRIREQGIVTVQYAVDNPFGNRKEPGWRLLVNAIPEYDLHLVQRDVNLVDYRNAGARDVVLFRTAYEPSLHFPPPDTWTDADRVNDVVYMGSPYDKRAEFIVGLWKKHGIRTKIWGTKVWDSVLSDEEKAALLQGTERWNNEYRESIWRSRICLAFVTHENCDDVAHKSFEIAASGGFLLAEDTAGHRAHFVDGEEAILFSSLDDCAEKIRRYLPDENLRQKISRAGARRAILSGYGNDARIKRVLDYVERKAGQQAHTGLQRPAPVN